MSQATRIKVLVVDPSVVCRRLLSQAVSRLPAVGQVTATPNGRIALARLEQTPTDLVLFDLSQDTDQGLDQLKKIHDGFPETVVIAMGPRDRLDPVIAVSAMQCGALELIAKPGQSGPAHAWSKFQQELSAMLGSIHGRRDAVRARRLSQRRARPGAAGEHSPGRGAAAPLRPAAARPITGGAFSVVAIGSSTGGPNALQQVIPLLPADLGVPLLLVQHIPPEFTGALADSLNQRSALTVVEAAEHQPLRPGVVYLAPGGRHMVVTPTAGEPFGVIGVNDGPPVNSCRPSADVLFKSLAAIGGLRTLAVVMTGMGFDGRAGVREIKARGGYCLSQSEDTCVVYGMPRAVDEAGLSDERVPLGGLARRITTLVQDPGASERPWR